MAEHVTSIKAEFPDSHALYGTHGKHVPVEVLPARSPAVLGDDGKPLWSRLVIGPDLLALVVTSPRTTVRCAPIRPSGSTPTARVRAAAFHDPARSRIAVVLSVVALGCITTYWLALVTLLSGLGSRGVVT